jgi:SAM-dependent methyltransferase
MDNCRMSSRYATGTGAGAITPDGCAVEFYALLPPGETEAAIIASAAEPGASVLELGAGAGRVTQSLVARGFSVVAVDESAEMLEHVDAAQTVVSTIEALELDRRFDVVVLASHLVNVPDDDVAQALLATCARHVAPRGIVMLERRRVEWFDEVVEAEAERDGIRYRLSDIERTSADVLTATISYTVGDRSWSQTFTTRRVDDARLRELLASVGLTLRRFLDADRGWALAEPIAS